MGCKGWSIALFNSVLTLSAKVTTPLVSTLVTFQDLPPRSPGTIFNIVTSSFVMYCLFSFSPLREARPLSVSLATLLFKKFQFTHLREVRPQNIVKMRLTLLHAELIKAFTNTCGQIRT